MFNAATPLRLRCADVMVLLICSVLRVYFQEITVFFLSFSLYFSFFIFFIFLLKLFF